MYGCPSIRTDLNTARQGRRSISDSQNYGDDVPAKYLINPPPFSDLSLTPDAMKIQKPKQIILSIFANIGYGDIHPDVIDVIFNNASNGRQTCSVNSYRNSLNEYLDAIETDQEELWLNANGITTN